MMQAAATAQRHAALEAFPIPNTLSAISREQNQSVNVRLEYKDTLYTVAFGTGELKRKSLITVVMKNKTVKIREL